MSFANVEYRATTKVIIIVQAKNKSAKTEVSWIYLKSKFKKNTLSMSFSILIFNVIANGYWNIV